MHGEASPCKSEVGRSPEPWVNGLKNLNGEAAPFKSERRGLAVQISPFTKRNRKIAPEDRLVSCLKIMKPEMLRQRY